MLTLLWVGFGGFAKGGLRELVNDADKLFDDTNHYFYLFYY